MAYRSLTRLLFWLCVVWGGLAVLQDLSPAIAADPPPANETAKEKELPSLPETEVVAPDRAPPSISGAPYGVPGSGTGQPRSVLEGSIFASPIADGYEADSSTSGTLIDVPNMDVPASVDVITESLREDQQALRMEDVLRNIGGAVRGGEQFQPDTFFLRGFQIRPRDYRKNGFLDPTITPRDFANIERIEVLKGPASVLYGAGQPSGVVSLITKKPLDQRMHYGGVQFGSFGLQRYTIDSTGPMNEQKSLLYRINAAYEDEDSFRDFGFAERTFVAPALTWALDDQTAITWQGEYVNDRRRFDTGVAAINGDVRALPISRFLGEPTDFQHYFDYRQSLVLTHQINEDWAWNVGGSSLFYGGPASVTYPVAPVPEFIFGPGWLMRSRQNVSPWQEQYHSVIANLSGKFHGNVFDHNVVVGTEQGWLISDPFHAAYSAPGMDPTTWYPINAFSPTYNTLAPATTIQFDSLFRQNRHGVYVEDLVDIGEHWKLLAGIRYDHVDTVFDRQLTPFPRVRTEQGFDHGAPRVGLIYQPVPERLSYYASYSDSFDPPGGGPRIDDRPLLPELGQTWEGGVKAKVSDSLTLTAAGFYITKENVTTDVFNGFTIVTSQIGQQRSQGVELDATGQITEVWSVLANWCYVDTLLHDPINPAFDGQPARGVPHNTMNVWSRYNFLQDKERQRTFGCALGMVFVGERLGDYLAPPTPQFLLPSYVRWDAGLYYQRGRFDTSLYLENLFGAEYYTSSISQYQIQPGAPLTARAQVGYRF